LGLTAVAGQRRTYWQGTANDQITFIIQETYTKTVAVKSRGERKVTKHTALTER